MSISSNVKHHPFYMANLAKFLPNTNFSVAGCLATCLIGFPCFLYGLNEQHAVRLMRKHRDKFISISTNKVKNLSDPNKEALLNEFSLKGTDTIKDFIFQNSIMFRLSRTDDQNHFIIRYEDVDEGYFGIFDPAFNGIFFDHNALLEYYAKLGKFPVGYRYFPFLAAEEKSL